MTIVLIGCSSAPVSPEVNPTQGAQILAGDYVMQLDQGDIDKSGLINVGLENNLSTWHFVLDEDGNFNAALNGSYITEENYTIHNDQIELYVKKASSEYDCNDIGRYYWSFEGNELRSAKIVDSCDPVDLEMLSKQVETVVEDIMHPSEIRL